MKTIKVFGPPGTGKTTWMLNHFAEEVKVTPPSRIAFLTFTRTARLEALSRAGIPEEELPYVKTIHAICYKLLGASQDRLVRYRNLREFGAKLGVNITGVSHDPWSLDVLSAKSSQPSKADRLLQLNHVGRHRRLNLKETLADAPSDIDFKYAKWFTVSYREWKTCEGLMDYTDLLIEYLKTGVPLDVDCLFVDEAQDLSKLQWEVVDKLGAKATRWYIAGDDDQAIFTWAGASPDAFNNRKADITEVLPQSYRIPKCVHTLSQRVVGRIKRRTSKVFHPREAEGEYRPVGNLSYELLGDSSTFVLYRNHFRGEQLADEMKRIGWPFLGNFSPLDRPEIREALSGREKILTRGLLTPGEARAVINFAMPIMLTSTAKARSSAAKEPIPSWEIISKPIANIDLHRVFPKMLEVNYVENCIKNAGIRSVLNPSVTLMSIHQCKGREANTVVLDVGLAQRTYEHFMKDQDDEHRVFYVGITRTRERLFTLLPPSSTSYIL